MIELPGFSAHDRVLVAAPHPDDEALATGGVLQVARAAGAACRVLIVTDGDNNPWPQRWIEKRWRIGPGERARWGAQRRAEALAALQVLGVDAAAARCLGFPDLGLTDLLMAGDRALHERLVGQFEEFRPTCVFLPALGDRHPDHSALHVAMQVAMRKPGVAVPQMFSFGVHGATATARDVALTLSAAQRDVKRAAIMMHATQMRLSRRRFVAYARPQELFRRIAVPGRPQDRHPLQGSAGADGTLELRIDHGRRTGGLHGQVLLAVLRRSDGACRRLRIAMAGAITGEVVDTVDGRRIGTAFVERLRAQTRVTVPNLGRLTGGWAKLARPAPGLFVLDRFGWQTLGSAAA